MTGDPDALPPLADDEELGLVVGSGRGGRYDVEIEDRLMGYLEAYRNELSAV